jgi:hypothetical protein
MPGEKASAKALQILHDEVEKGITDPKSSAGDDCTPHSRQDPASCRDQSDLLWDGRIYSHQPLVLDPNSGFLVKKLSECVYSSITKKPDRQKQSDTANDQQNHIQIK